MSGYRAALLANLHRAARKHDNKGQDGRLRKDKVLDAVAFQDHLTRSLDFRFPKSMSRKESLPSEDFLLASSSPFGKSSSKTSLTAVNDTVSAELKGYVCVFSAIPKS